MKCLLSSTILLLAAAGMARAAGLWQVSNVSQLNQAITELKTMYPNGGTIVLAPGTYFVSQTVEFNSVPMVNIVGSGWNTVWRKIGAGNAIVFTNNSSFSEVRNILIVGDTSVGSGSGIVFQGSGACTVDNCRLTNFAESGIRFEGDVGAMSSNTVSNCLFNGNLGEQLYSFENHDFFITRNQFTCGSVAAKTGATLDHSSAGTYSENSSSGNTIALKIGGGSHYNRIENNSFGNSTKENIILGETGGDASRYDIFLGNTIHTNSTSLSGGYTAVTAHNASEINFCQNTIFSSNDQYALMKRCLEIDSDCYNWIVKNNIMQHSNHPPALTYASNAGHIIVDNMILSIPGDINNDGKINLSDLAILVNHWLEGVR